MILSSRQAGSRSRELTQGKSLAEIAFAALQAHDWPEGIEPNLDSSAAFDPVTYSYPHGTHLAAMEVDTETGA